MLLRRITEHVKAQNWVAVVLDFAIVVVGVFVGLQVSNWNEARQLQNEEYTTLVRLQREAEDIVAFWQEYIFFSKQMNNNRRRLLEVLARGQMSEGERGEIDDAFMRLGHYPANNPPRTVYNELVASGGLRLISDVATREAVSLYVTQLEFIDGQLIQFRTNLPGLHEAFQSHIFSSYEPGAASLRRYEYDIEALSTDRQFISDIVDAVRNQLQFHNYRQVTLEAALHMCQEISRAVSQTCDVGEIDMERHIRKDGVNQ
jgi:hypothetical protein